jgi:exopolysaccharide biosynthesis predicted pyruvyltransferase EpsI
MRGRVGRRATALDPAPGGSPLLDGRLVAQWRAQLLATLARCIAPGRSVVLLDVPHHANVGDNAILLGELAALRALGRNVLYVPATASSDGARLSHRIGSRPILLHGGGNLGDLWPAHQRLRERILAQFPEHPIVQLPQSIAFAQADSVARARRAFERHRGFTLLVRDEQSRAFAEDQLGTCAILAPDGAFALGQLRPRSAPSRDVLVLARTDHEAHADRRLPPGVATEDWTTPRVGPRGRGLERIARELGCRPGRSKTTSAALARAAMLTWAGVSAEHVRRGIDLLSSARVVVTDRLHAHVLSLLLGIPHVVTDNVSGKIRSFYETWTIDSELVTWSESLEHGVQIARQLASERTTRSGPSSQASGEY